MSNPRSGRPRRKPAANRRLGSEALEPRLLLDADGVIWGADARLTLSFAPDGTQVVSDSSALFAQMDALAPRNQWQSAILRGFSNLGTGNQWRYWCRGG